MGESENVMQQIEQFFAGIDLKIWIAIGIGALLLIVLTIVIVCAIKRKISEREEAFIEIKTYTPNEFFALRRGTLACKISP